MINSQLLLYVNLVIGGLLVLYFILGRHKPKEPVRLNLRAKDSNKQQLLDPETVPQSRSLGIMFMYNGHDWEAHEVLGVPQGASMHQVTAVYQQLIKTAHKDSLAFYEQAYAAISNRHRKHQL